MCLDMKIYQIFFILGLIGVSFAIPLHGDDKELPLATDCVPDDCKLPNCRCESTLIPGNIDIKDTPQFVFLTYDDAVRADNHDIYSKALYGKKNPDGCNVSATLFVSHEYTVYPKVHDLYEHGLEVALHSITHFADTGYWKNASVDLLKKEFGGENELIAKFANVPADSMSGIRVPFLQLSGNNSFETIKELGLKFDCSWPTRNQIEPGLWPYTLDYKTAQDCQIGPCPTASIPGVWVVPMLDWKDQKNVPCSMVDQCVNIPSDADELTEWIKTNFHRNYDNNKAPFGFYIHSIWLMNPVHVEAYNKFIDYLQTLSDVYIVNISRGLQWVQQPVAINSKDWPACPEVVKSPCEDQACRYVKEDETEIYMHICNNGDACPPHYPSIDNPTGK